MAEHETKRVPFWLITLGSVGVVYGDIGTSPIYALREALGYAARDGLDPQEVIGTVSLLVWTVILVVTLKYVMFLLRADNRGEGGILALYALCERAAGGRSKPVLLLAVAGAALFYGDAAITPAISVLSAVEGLKLVTPGLGPYVAAIALGVLAGLFAAQRRGTSAVARWFGPVTALWFAALAGFAVPSLAAQPAILAALNPFHAATFLATNGMLGLLVLGAVFLAVTGAEALYADLGHFGRRPIQTAWFLLVFPALILNYLGQGALVLRQPAAAADPFFLLAPDWGLPLLVGLATAATVIASQAVISGAFSMTRQAVQLGLLPRLDVRHTSALQTGQIYLPLVNWTLLAAVAALVFLFETSGGLAAAYGIAVIGTMSVTTALAFVFLRRVWAWPLSLALGAISPIAALELVFLAANLVKLPEGGYLPLLLAAGLTVCMMTWLRGTAILLERGRRSLVALSALPGLVRSRSITRIPGTSVFLTSDPSTVPTALLHNLKHNHVLHERVIVLTVRIAPRPRVQDDQRVSLAWLDNEIVCVTLHYGFMESPNVPRGLALARDHGVRFEIMKTTFFLGRRKILAEARAGMPLWQDRLFIALSRLASDPSDFYGLPRDRVVELGAQIAV